MNLVTASTVKYQYRQLHKFGGSSLADVKCYQRVANIMKNYSQVGDIMVVSSAGTTTNQLIDWLKLSQTDRVLANQVKQKIRCYQQNLIIGLLPAKKAKILKLAFLADFNRLNTLLDNKIYNDIYAEIVAHGEIWSARLMSSVLEEFGLQNHWLDARLFLRAEFSAQPKIDEILSLPLLQQILQKHSNKRLVITGFIAQSKQGKTVLLGRNGSDYSATQVGALAGVNKVTIWSDVAGVYSADPHKVKDACLLPRLRFDEATELARLATSILHTRTLQPISISNIDLHLRCSYQPEQGSTKIERIFTSGSGVKIVTSHDDICLVELNIEKQKNFSNIYKDIDLFLNKKQLEPLAAGLHPDRKLIQLCYTREIADSALNALQKIKITEKLSLRDHFSLIAVIGADVGKNPLQSNRFYQQLKDQPVEFIWHSKKEISLVAVLRKTKTSYLVKKLHHSLFRSENSIGLVLFDASNISSSFLKFFFFIKRKSSSVHSDLKFIFADIVNSFYSLLNYNGIDLIRVLYF